MCETILCLNFFVRHAGVLCVQGLKLAWQSAVSGREMCPDDIYGEQEIHINGDIALAFQNYYYLTEVSCSAPPHHFTFPQINSCRLGSFLQDLTMFTDGRGSQLIWGVADYWVSRVTWSPDDQKYHLLGTVLGSLSKNMSIRGILSVRELAGVYSKSISTHGGKLFTSYVVCMWTDSSGSVHCND